MALVSCPECAAQVSEEAALCPACGKQLRKPTRGFAGKLFLGIFIVFNLLMVWWLIAGLGAAGEHMQGMSEAEKTGAAVGTGIGVMMILFVWAAGDIVFGMLAFFTRARVR